MGDEIGTTERLQLLLAVGIFKDLDQKGREEIALELTERLIGAGETLFQSGEPGDEIFIVVAGRFRIFLQQVDGSVVPVRDVGLGEALGEIAVLTSGKRSATVVAIRDSRLLVLSGQSFERLVERHPSVALSLARTQIDRLRRLQGAGNSRAFCEAIAVVPAGSSCGIDAISKGLSQRLEKFGKVLHVSSGQIVRQFGNSEHDIGTWLESQEAVYRFIVYEVDLSLTPWTQRCLRHADTLLFVAEDQFDSALNMIERELTSIRSLLAPPRRHLVIVRQEEAMPISRRWLSSRKVDMHHHVKTGSGEDISRVARFVAGRANGLVLGGGGARGFAHIGVIRALREADIPIDVVGGTSMGAFIAALAASQMDHATMVEICERTFIKRGVFDFTLPFVSLVAGKKITTSLLEIHGENLIEDLPLKFFCVTADLRAAECCVHESGSITKWVRTSMSIPGIAQPMVNEGRVLCDGGVLNNLPVDVMERFTGRRIIAVAVNPPVDLSIAEESREFESPWRILLNKLNPFAEGRSFPGILSILQRSTILGSVRSAALVKEKVSVLIQPSVAVRVFDWKAMDIVIQAGYESAQRELATWQQASEDLPNAPQPPVET